MNGVVEYISGKDCSCSNITCSRTSDGEICGGPDRGTCVCNKCVCKEGWTGAVCNKACSKSKDNCYDPSSFERQVKNIYLMHPFSLISNDHEAFNEA